MLSHIRHDPNMVEGSGYLNTLLYYLWGITDGKADQTVPQVLTGMRETDIRMMPFW